ncbi:hypothetical protein HPB50_023321 [Hyalomma asiaticum]|uniref:Uncharacterized protein n=1 Tax=Hyalomma asiaticum TaxID=266040 RepID=A0ACB7TPK5_HYAAI|nr:hypothetical protein HPB50_023321 [Hyalomma asiaticum]
MVHPWPRTRAATKRRKKCRQWRAHAVTCAPRLRSVGDSAEHRRQLDAAARITMTWHLYYIHTFTGSLKIYQVIDAITSIVLLTVVDYDLSLNYPTMRPHALLMSMVCSSFFLSMLFIIVTFVMGSTDVPCSIFYRMHGVLATDAFMVSGLTNISQENNPGPANTGLFAAALCVQKRLTFFADTVIAYESPIDNDVALANDYVDNVLGMMRNDRELLAAIDPLQVPDFGENSFVITNGQVLGLSAFYRSGNSTVQLSHDTAIVTTPAAVNDVFFTGRHRASRFGLTISGDIEASVNRVNTLIVYRAPIKGGEARLEYFQASTNSLAVKSTPVPLYISTRALPGH